jgi:Baseplate J-like protein
MPTNVPDLTFTATGWVAPAESAILQGVQADQQAAFPTGGLNTDLSTPQGQLAQSQAAIIGNKNNQFLQLANGMDPAFATGRMQDGIGRIYYLKRLPAQPTTVQATCYGKTGTVIPVNAQAVDQAGNIYFCSNAGTIPAGGSVILPFACAVVGPVACPVGFLNAIFKTISGWDSINNLTAGVVGTLVESRYAFENRRQASVAINAQGSNQAVRGALLALPGVLDAYVVDNPTPAVVSVGGQNINPNSLYCAVSGGSGAQIGKTIWLKKNACCGTTGNTPITVVDDVSGYQPPLPSYTINYQIPTPTPILFSISMQLSASVPSNAVGLVQSAVIASFNGQDGGPRAAIGAWILSNRFYANIAALGSWAVIYSIQLGTIQANQQAILMNINQVPTLSAGNISVTFS